VDDTRTREPHSGRPRPELPQSLAWLSEPAPETPSEGSSAGAPPSAAPPSEDSEALPTLLPFSAPPAGAARSEPPLAEPPVEWPAPEAGEVSLFEPVHHDVPAQPPAHPRPLPTWHRFWPPLPDQDAPSVPVGEHARPDAEPGSSTDDERPADDALAEDTPAEDLVVEDPLPEDAAVEVPSAVVPLAQDAAPDVAAGAPPAPDLGDPGLRPLWAAVREKLPGSNIPADGLADVRGLDRGGRQALAGLLGVPAVRAATRVDLAELERIVHEVTGLPLAAAAERFAPIDRFARRARAHTRTAPLRAAQEWLDAHPATAAQAWTPTWLETVRREVVGDTGLTEHEVVSALEILAAVTGRSEDEAGWWLRTELAAQAADDEHALDEGSAVATLVLRGLAAAAGVLPPPDTAARRRLWARFQVVTDLVSTTCLAVGVAPAEADDTLRWREAGRAGIPIHVTAHDLRAASGAWVPIADGWGAVLVLDSPRVLEAVAERFTGRVAAICTDGVPGPVTLDLLARLRASGAALRFTTGFDQPGLTVGALLAQRFGATPWRMTPQVYLAAARSDLPPLTGRVAEPGWDGDLVTAMARAGRAVPAEQVLDELLEALAADMRDAGDAR
jgi:uncharacterized protein (TIGR02679 family)